MVVAYGLYAPDVSKLVRELRDIDKSLLSQMRKDFRTEIRPYANDLKANFPNASRVPSGFTTLRGSRTSKTADQRSPFVYRKPSLRVDADPGKAMRKGNQYRTILRLLTTDKRPFSAFSVFETARQGRNWRGDNMIRGLEKKGFVPIGKGRWVIDQFYQKQSEMVRVARKIIDDYSRKVSDRFARRFQ